MWQSLIEHIPAILGALVAALGAFRLRRIVSWMAAVKERETLTAMLENEQQWRRCSG